MSWPRRQRTAGRGAPRCDRAAPGRHIRPGRAADLPDPGRRPDAHGEALCSASRTRRPSVDSPRCTWPGGWPPIADLRAPLGPRSQDRRLHRPGRAAAQRGLAGRAPTREHYARHLYRQAGAEQIEWTFPLEHKDAYFDAVLPETFALMRLVDAHRPTLMASLHNAELGGVYYYLSRRSPGYTRCCRQSPAGGSAHAGEPGGTVDPAAGRWIFRSLDARDAYDHLELTGGTRTCPAATPPAPTPTATARSRWSASCPTGARPPRRRRRVRYDRATRCAGQAPVDELAGSLTGVLAALDGLVDSPFLRAARFFARRGAGWATDLARRPPPARPQGHRRRASRSTRCHMRGCATAACSCARWTPSTRSAMSGRRCARPAPTSRSASPPGRGRPPGARRHPRPAARPRGRPGRVGAGAAAHLAASLD